MRTPARHLLALDWGTSSLRAQLSDAAGNILHTTATQDGILSVPAGGFDAAFERICGAWLRDYPDTLVLAAGMIGSRQGWHEAPYLDCPAGFADMAEGLLWPAPDRALAFLPGLRTLHHADTPDVMRGEEVQIFGALDALGVDEGVFVLPGTHSKWAVVENRRIVRFHTFMTGELYALLRHQSILARLMPAQDAAPSSDPALAQAFVQGCEHAREGTLLHRLFTIRPRGLFDQLPAAAQPEYLSGLLVGEEIREAIAMLGEAPAVHLVCNATLAERYGRALSAFGLTGAAVPDGASFRGMLAIAREQGLLA